MFYDGRYLSHMPGAPAVICRGARARGGFMAEKGERKGEMTVEEAGRKGGHKGGEKVLSKYGPEFYSKIGHKGGQKVKELIEKGKQTEARRR
jgi:general stress protein YciG